VRMKHKTKDPVRKLERPPTPTQCLQGDTRSCKGGMEKGREGGVRSGRGQAPGGTVDNLKKKGIIGKDRDIKSHGLGPKNGQPETPPNGPVSSMLVRKGENGFRRSDTVDIRQSTGYRETGQNAAHVMGANSRSHTLAEV